MKKDASSRQEQKSGKLQMMLRNLRKLLKSIKSLLRFLNRKSKKIKNKNNKKWPLQVVMQRKQSNTCRELNQHKESSLLDQTRKGGICQMTTKNCKLQHMLLLMSQKLIKSLKNWQPKPKRNQNLYKYNLNEFCQKYQINICC